MTSSRVVPGLAFRVEGLGLGVQGLGLIGFRVDRESQSAEVEASGQLCTHDCRNTGPSGRTWFAVFLSEFRRDM